MNHISPDNLALYAMDLLSDAEATPLRHHLEQCSECRAELGATLGDLALFALTADTHSPPALMRQHLLKQVAREKKTVPIAPLAIEHGRAPIQPQATQLQPSGQTLSLGGMNNALSSNGNSLSSSSSLDYDDLPPQRNVAGMILGLTGWAVAAGLGFFAFTLYQQRGRLDGDLQAIRAEMAHRTNETTKAHEVADLLTDTSAMHVTLNMAKGTPTAAPVARVTYSADKGTLIFMASNMEPLQMYKTYELWLIPADGRNPMPAGVFHPDPQGNVTMVKPEMPAGVSAKAFGVTVEDEGGAKQPTLPILMLGM